jgi:hypothetical protein
MRSLYPIDWPQLSQVIRFGRAKGRCEFCARPHGAKVLRVPGGRWFDSDANRWRDGRGGLCEAPWGVDLDELRSTRVVLATAHLDHDPGHNHPNNLQCLCQRCHMLHTCLTTWRSAGLLIGCDGHSAICSWVHMFGRRSRRNGIN